VKKLIFTIIGASVLIGVLVAPLVWKLIFPSDQFSFGVRVSAPEEVDTEVILSQGASRTTAAKGPGSWERQITVRRKPEATIRARAFAEGSELEVRPAGDRRVEARKTYEFLITGPESTQEQDLTQKQDLTSESEETAEQERAQEQDLTAERQQPVEQERAQEQNLTAERQQPVEQERAQEQDMTAEQQHETLSQTVENPLRVAVTSGGQPVAAAALAVEPPDFSPSARTQTRADGVADFTIRGRPGSQFRISASQGCRSARSPLLRIEVGAPEELDIELPALVESTYRIRVTRGGNPVPGVQVETSLPASCKSSATTGADGIAALKVSAPLETPFYLSILDGTKTKRHPESGQLTHALQGPFETIEVQLPAPEPRPLEAFYIFRAIRNEMPQASVEVTIMDLAGNRIDRETTDARGVARLRVSVSEGSALRYEASTPAPVRDCVLTGQLQGPLVHNARPDSILIRWTCKPSEAEPQPIPDFSLETADNDIATVLRKGWTAAFRVMQCRPGTWGNRESCQQNAAVKDLLSGMDGALGRLRNHEGHPSCPEETRVQCVLARMLAAGARGDVESCESHYRQFRQFGDGLTVPRMPAALLYLALARTIKGATEPDAVAEVIALLDRAEGIDPTDKWTKKNTVGRLQCVRAVALWQGSFSDKAEDPAQLISRALVSIDQWEHLCRNDPGCRDDVPFIKNFRTIMERD